MTESMAALTRLIDQRDELAAENYRLHELNTELMAALKVALPAVAIHGVQAELNQVMAALAKAAR